MKFKKIIAATIILFFSSFAFTYNLFFDLNGVLLKTSKLRAFSKLGIKAILYPDLKSRLFDFMNFIDDQKPTNSIFFQGKELPSYFCKWQKGQISCQEITDLIKTKADKNLDFFHSQTEQELIKKSADFFLPKNNIDISKLSKSTIALVKKCKDKKSDSNKSQNQLFLTSNFDKETFKLVKKHFPEIITLFDEDKLIISANIKSMKPEPEFYDYIVKKFKLNPNDCYLIDDAPENIEGAKKYGIKAILYKNAPQLKRELKKIKAL